ncbi:MAG TPA: hypothetical protein VFN70_18330 [Burkholderiales bacterium]|nr:hypothetical protein [Burkholderiales bacterium]
MSEPTCEWSSCCDEPAAALITHDGSGPGMSSRRTYACLDCAKHAEKTCDAVQRIEWTVDA